MYCASLSDAVDAARGFAVADDKVLLSPACASFDMFDDFKARADLNHQARLSSHPHSLL